MSATATNNGSGSLIMEQGFMSLMKEQLGRLYWGAVDVQTTEVGAERLGSSLNKEKWGEGASGWKITKRKDEGSGRFWLS